MKNLFLLIFASLFFIICRGDAAICEENSNVQTQPNIVITPSANDMHIINKMFTEGEFKKLTVYEKPPLKQLFLNEVSS